MSQWVEYVETKGPHDLREGQCIAQERTKSPQRPRPSCMAPHQSAAMVIHSRQCGTSDRRNYFGGGGVGEAPWQSAALGSARFVFPKSTS